MSDKLEKLLPSSSGHHNVNHQERQQSGFNVSKNPSQQQVDPSENTQRSNSLSLGQTSATSHVSNNNGHNNVILTPETGKNVVQRVEQNECQKNPISSKKHSLASSDGKHESIEASANCKNVKGKS